MMQTEPRVRIVIQHASGRLERKFRPTETIQVCSIPKYRCCLLILQIIYDYVHASELVSVI